MVCYYDETRSDQIDGPAYRQGPLTSPATLESFSEVVKHLLTAGASIYVRGFGSFVPMLQGAKVTCTISQQTAYLIEAHIMPVCKLSAEFNEQTQSHPVTKVTD